MYGYFYGMHRPPFSLHPDPGFFFVGQQYSTATTMLDYAVFRGDGIVVITGEVGCGKSAMLRCFLASAPELLALGMVTNPSLLENSPIHGVMLAFGLDPGAAHNAELHASFQAFLHEQFASGRAVMLIVDEAQHLSRTTLEQLRMLTNPAVDGDGVLQLVLAGQPQLKQTLDDPALKQLTQRIVARFHLGPLGAGETQAYIVHRLYAAGASRPIFSDAAIAAIHRGSSGVPRVINLICDAALLYGYAEELSEIDEALIGQVLLDRGLSAGNDALLAAAAPPRLVRAPEERVMLQQQDADREIARQLFGMSRGKK